MTVQKLSHSLLAHDGRTEESRGVVVLRTEFMTGQDRLAFFEEEGKNYTWKPFVEKYFSSTEFEEGAEYEITSIEPAKSGAGYKLETSEFVIFLRTGTTLLDYILEAVAVWTKSSGNPSLVAVLTNKRPYYRLAANIHARRAWTEIRGKYIVAERSTDESKRAGNPFLNARLVPPSLPAQESREMYPGEEEEEPTPKKTRRGSSKPQEPLPNTSEVPY